MKEWIPEKNEIYMFLRVKQADGINMKKVHNRVKEEISRINIITELNDRNQLKTQTSYPQ